MGRRVAVAEAAAPARPAIIDCDLHNEIDSVKDLYHISAAQAAQANVTSLVMEGAFDRFGIKLITWWWSCPTPAAPVDATPASQRPKPSMLNDV